MKTSRTEKGLIGAAFGLIIAFGVVPLVASLALMAGMLLVLFLMWLYVSGTWVEVIEWLH
jgi:hypothetical protein